MSKIAIAIKSHEDAWSRLKQDGEILTASTDHILKSGISSENKIIDIVNLVGRVYGQRRIDSVIKHLIQAILEHHKEFSIDEKNYHAEQAKVLKEELKECCTC